MSTAEVQTIFAPLGPLHTLSDADDPRIRGAESPAAGRGSPDLLSVAEGLFHAIDSNGVLAIEMTSRPKKVCGTWGCLRQDRHAGLHIFPPETFPRRTHGGEERRPPAVDHTVSSGPKRKRQTEPREEAGRERAEDRDKRADVPRWTSSPPASGGDGRDGTRVGGEELLREEHRAAEAWRASMYARLFPTPDRGRRSPQCGMRSTALHADGHDETEREIAFAKAFATRPVGGDVQAIGRWVKDVQRPRRPPSRASSSGHVESPETVT